MVGEAMMDESTMIITDFQSKNPPDPGIASYIEILGNASVEKLRNSEPYGLDTLYGTWRYDGSTDKWYLYEAGDPANAILFEWSYLDTASIAHKAEILIDSLTFYEDSMPTDLWAGVYSDDELLAWLKLEAAYLSLDEINEVSFVYEIVDVIQVGIAMTSDVAIDTSFTGTVSLWTENLTNDYRVDFEVTANNDEPEEIVLSDSDGWKMDIDISDEGNTEIIDSVEYERREVSGEITKNGNHAADIGGYVLLDPEDDGIYSSDITIVFPDGTEGNLEDYLAMGNIPELP